MGTKGKLLPGLSVSVHTAHGGGYAQFPGPFTHDWIYPECLILGLVQRMLPLKMRGWREGPTSLSVLQWNMTVVPFLVPGTQLVTKHFLFCFVYLLSSDLVQFSQAGFWADFSSLPLGPRGQAYQGWTRGWLTSSPGPDTGIPAGKSVHLLELP